MSPHEKVPVLHTYVSHLLTLIAGKKKSCITCLIRRGPFEGLLSWNRSGHTSISTKKTVKSKHRGLYRYTDIRESKVFRLNSEKLPQFCVLPRTQWRIKYAEKKCRYFAFFPREWTAVLWTIYKEHREHSGLPAVCCASPVGSRTCRNLAHREESSFVSHREISYPSFAETQQLTCQIQIQDFISICIHSFFSGGSMVNVLWKNSLEKSEIA